MGLGAPVCIFADPRLCDSFSDVDVDCFSPLLRLELFGTRQVGLRTADAGAAILDELGAATPLTARTGLPSCGLLADSLTDGAPTGDQRGSTFVGVASFDALPFDV